MITYVKDKNILDAEVGVFVVIPTNTEGIAGKGLAKEWADKFPTAAHQYVKEELK